jgi:hypothetical protein
MTAPIFTQLFGFPEESHSQVQSRLRVEGDMLVSPMNGASYTWGRLETPSLTELRQRVKALDLPVRSSTCRELVADAKSLHADPANTGAVFQVASQFNLLEMCGPSETPEMGVSKYAGDPTQGPACALACFAGTVYRNYFVPLEDQIGQTAHKQIECLADLGEALGNRNSRLWQMQNGYCLATAEGLREIRQILEAADETERDRLRGLLRVGVQWDTEVTLPGAGHLVSQVYASALPVGYSPHSASDWEPFARLVLKAAYEATLLAAALTPERRVFLTLLGGGVFGNQIEWIVDAIQSAMERAGDLGLDIQIVSYRYSNPAITPLLSTPR